jgi:CheY-like chemotaxis protein
MMGCLLSSVCGSGALNWLIAEDEADIRNLITMMCQVWGYQPLAFENGQKVWDWLDSVETGQYQGDLPQFVLMDIRMPGKKGNEIAQRMRSMPNFQDTPIALMTAFALDEDERNSIIDNNGVDRIISKPLPDFEQLHNTLHQIIESKKAS